MLRSALAGKVGQASAPFSVNGCKASILLASS